MLFSTRDSDPGRDGGAWTHTPHTLSQESELKSESQTSRENLDEVISCTQSNCTCECFQPGRTNLRSCDHCKHSWVTHAVSKLSVCTGTECTGQVEIVQCSLVFDISTLLLYGTQALPIRMKILLDRLFSVLTHTQVITILHTLGWTLRDYIRGYILQDSMGKVLDRWVMMTPEEEVVTLQQFLRFGETKSIVELMAVQDQQDRVSRTSRSDSDIRLFIESSQTRGLQSGSDPPSMHHFENLPGGHLAFLQPFQYTSPLLPSSTGPARVQQSPESKPGLDSRRADSLTPFRGCKLMIRCNREAERQKPSHKLHSSTDGHAQVSSVTGETPGSSSSSSSSSSSGARDGGLLRKGRVSCSACGKTFYDKGTLKIHYNAVHLKIKHRCTIQGCNMVFSSLRSRNRHSANPNPRLHTPALRNTHSPQHQPCATVLPSRVRPPADLSPPIISSLESHSPHISSLESHSPHIFSKVVQPVLPFFNTAVPSRSSPGSGNPLQTSTALTDHPLKHTTVIHSNNNHTLRPEGGATPHLTANQNRPESKTDAVPKKKSRKSSMPVKIKREEEDRSGHHDEGPLLTKLNNNNNNNNNNNHNNNHNNNNNKCSNYSSYRTSISLYNHISTTTDTPEKKERVKREDKRERTQCGGEEKRERTQCGGEEKRERTQCGGEEKRERTQCGGEEKRERTQCGGEEKRERTQCGGEEKRERTQCGGEEKRERTQCGGEEKRERTQCGGEEKRERTQCGGEEKRERTQCGGEEKRERTQCGGEEKRERTQCGGEESLLKVKEEEFDPSYNLHCAFTDWVCRGVMSADRSDLQNNFNSDSDQEDDDDEEQDSVGVYLQQC